MESGAAVFAATYSDMQTAADKCEEMEEGYAQCSQFLYGEIFISAKEVMLLPGFVRWSVSNITHKVVDGFG